MSVEAMAIALHHSQARGTAKLILLGIANHDGDGGSWPSLETLGKYGRCTRDNVRKHLGQLERLGEIRRAIQKGGLAGWEDHLRPNLYHFLLTCPASCDGTRNHRERTPAPLPTFDPELSTPPAELLGDPQPNRPPNHPSKPSIETSPKSHVLNRARGKCGHPLLLDALGYPMRRYCRDGCKPSEVA